jgi:hypothetical protein
MRGTDIFSLGVVFYELVTGALPFPGDNAVQVIDGILHREAPAAVPRAGTGGAELQRILRRMLAKDREQRYQSLRELSRDLDAIGGEASPRWAGARGPVVAVMSLTNITGSPEDDWLGTGIAETVTADLKCVEGLTVVGRERVWEAVRKMGSIGAPDDEAQATRAGARAGRALGRHRGLPAPGRHRPRHRARDGSGDGHGRAHGQGRRRPSARSSPSRTAW